MSIWSENLRHLRKHKGITQKELGAALGVNGSRIRDYELEVSEPNVALLIRMAQYFNLSLDDFIKNKISAPPISSKPAIVPLQQSSRILVITETDNGTENIVHIPVKARAGYLSGYEDPVFIESLPSYRLPGVRTGTYRSFELQGDSMLPLGPGTIVVGRYVESWRDIRNNHTYILVTEQDGVVYKRVINKVKTKDQLVLMSDNPVYEPYSVPIEEVREAWAYYCHLSNAGAEQKSNLDQLLKAVEELKCEVASLKSGS